MNPERGASSPFSKLRNENATAIAARLQPSSLRIGSMITPKPKVAMPITRKLVAAPALAMYQP